MDPGTNDDNFGSDQVAFPEIILFILIFFSFHQWTPNFANMENTVYYVIDLN